MNRLCYRIVFNRTRAMPMAVAETASSTGTGRRTAAPGTAQRGALPRGGVHRFAVHRFTIPAVRLAVWIALGTCMALPTMATAQIVADPNAGANRPTVVTTANGLPQVNITRPSNAGVSTNHYTQFDVNRGGAILNNSPGIVNTQQAGFINGNPNLLPGGSARIIVNQVNSMSPSQLRGYVEVAGPGAQVVIANPNGILVDGAGFINTPRATLTTGTPIYGGSGSLDAFRVTGGQISFEGGGLNAASVDQVDVIARAVKTNAALYANRLNVVAGANNVSYNTLEANAIAGTGPAPSAGIDVSQLGGMYANKILLASTELGVGVSLRGVAAAQAGDMILTAQGKLVLAGQTNASGNLAIAARDGIDNSGTTYALGAMRVQADGTLANSGTLAAQQGLSVNAQTIASTGTLAAGMTSDGATAGAADLTLNASGALAATGRNSSSGNATLQGSSVNLAGSQTAANGNLTLTAGAMDLSGATVQAAGTLAANAAALGTRQGKVLGGNVVIAAQSLDNTGGQIEGTQLGIRTTGDLVNRGGSLKQTGATDTTLTAGGALDNTGGTIVANGTSLSIGASKVANDGGTLSHAGTGSLTVTSQQTLTNTGGVIQTNGDLAAYAGTLNNSSGAMSAQGKAILVASGDLSNRQGRVYGNTGLTLASGGGIDNTSGSAQTAGNLSVGAAGALFNTGGTFAANGTSGTATVTATSIDNTRGAIVNAGDGATTVTAANTLTNTAGKIGANGDITVAAQTLANDAGAQIAAGRALDLRVRSRVDNRSGTLYGQSLTLNQMGAALDNASGQVLAGKDVSVNVGSMSNLGGAVKANQDVAVAGALSGSGTMIAGRDLTLSVAGDYTNDAANQLHANGNLSVTTTGTLTNTGTLASAGAVAVTGTNVVNAASAGINATNTTVTATNLVSNAGRIEGDTVRVTGPTVTNTGTVIGNNVQVQGTDIVNNGATALMAAVQNLNLYATSSLTRAVQNLDGATLYSAGNMQIARDGTRDASTGLLANQTNTLINRSANIEADGDIDIAANQVSNTRTRIVTAAGTPTETASQTLTLWQAGLSGIDLSVHLSLTFPQWSWSTSAAQVSTPQTNALRNPITVTVDKADVKNLDPANKTLSFVKSPIEEYLDPIATASSPCDQATGICTREIATRPTQYYQAITDNGTTYSITLWPDWDPNLHIRPDEVKQANFGHDYNEISRTTVTMTATDQLVSATDAAKIQASGNIRINSNNGNILNQSSTMAAGGNLIRVAANGTIQDVGTVLQQTVTTQDTSTFYWHQRTGGSSDTQVVAYPSAPQAPTTTSALAAVATANQNVQTTAQNVTVASVNTVGAAVTGATVSGGGATGTQAAGATGNAGQAGAVGTSTVKGVVQTLGTPQGGIPNLTLPTNGLYRFRTAPGDTYLVATDPRFTQYTNFISSDYMLGALGLDPQKTQKRLGDGFYEEKLVRDQITQLTGKTFLTGYTDQLEEYKALMNNGVTYAKAFDLTPGVGLTDEQMRQLTTDMVWMVSQDVTLPDGTTQSVLVPKVYLAQGHGVDLNSTGALVAGNTVSIDATDTVNNSGSIVGNLATQVVGTDIVNRGSIGGTGTTVVSATQDVRNLGGRIGGQDVVVAAGRDIVNQSQTITNTTTLANGNTASATGIGAVGTIEGSNNVAMLAGRDITLAGGSVDAGNNAMLAAGRDLNIGTLQLGTTQDASAHDGRDHLREETVVNAGSRVKAGGSLTAVAGRDATLTASAIDAGGDAALVAGRDTTVTAAMDTRTQDAGAFSNKASQFTTSSYDESTRAATIDAGGNVTLGAGQTAVVNQILQGNGIAAAQSDGTGNVAILGSGVSSTDGAVKLVATGDVTIGTVTEQHRSDSWSHSESSGFMSKKETTTTSSTRDSVAVGSVVSGDTITGSAGRDMTIAGSTVAGTHDLSLEAGRNLTITTAESTSESQTYSHTKATGFGATGGGLSYGMRDQKDTTHDSSVTQTGSLVGSTDGSVTLKAGSTLQITGSQVIAAKDLTGVGADVIIEAAKGSEHHDETHEIKQTGFTLGVSGGAIGAAINAGQKISAGTKSQDGRASALWGIAAGRVAYDAAMGASDAMKALEKSAGPQGAAVTLSFGSSQSKNTLTQDSTTHTGSNVQAGGAATFIATGVDAAGNKTAGNLNIIGSDVSATKVGLGARGDVNIASATDTYESHSTNKSSGGSIGASYGAQGFGVSVSGQMSKGNSDAVGTTQVNSHVTGSESVTIVSGNDTNILGGVVSGGKVSADIGGNLNIASRQDTEVSHAEQKSMGGGLSISQGGASGSFSASKGKADSHYANVTEQSGIRAGDDGFDINVKGNTDLKGAIIASTADEDKNKLTTGTLTWSDIENRSDYSGTSMGLSGGLTFGQKAIDQKSGQTAGKNTGGVSPLIPQDDSGSQRGVTQPGIAAGTITITDQTNQNQDVATLNRDLSNTNTTVGKGPDLNNVLGKQADMMAAAQAAGEAVGRTVGDIADAKRKAATDAQIAAQIAYDANPSEENRAALDQAMADVDGWKEGGPYRAGLHAAGGAMIAALGGGNALAGATGAGLSSLAAEQLAALGKAVADSANTGNKDLDKAIGNLAANLAAGGIGSVVGGGSGAATAANADRFNRQLHQSEYDLAKKNAKVLADKLGISVEEAEGRIIAEILRNSDKETADASGGKHDYEVRKIIGCQNLNCDGSSDLNYANRNFNNQYIGSNKVSYDLGKSQLSSGQTYNQLVTSNVAKDPIGTTVAGIGMIGLGYLTGGSGTAVGMKLFGAGVGAAANYAYQSGATDWKDVAIAGTTGFITTGSGFGSSLVANTGGSLFGSAIKGENPISGMAGAALSTGVGYGVGKAIETSIGKIVSPKGWWSPDWIALDYGVSKWNAPSVWPGAVAGVASAWVQEPVSNGVKDQVEGMQK
ncbi:two-partner secretion domain-containing protein [Cupriavidus plantarum]|uniref:two-partner secretion domain-containing protein n=1 Tax=Cupriavidus plantarum TaxID=942865 RepID=UPI000EB54652|nr:hemagglutinin repeat-containing protein [Cupriavidus plantarum]RLK33530.1 filamentous hemagglutinin [Cupriavidus plantarum]